MEPYLPLQANALRKPNGYRGVVKRGGAVIFESIRKRAGRNTAFVDGMMLVSLFKETPNVTR